MKNTPRENSQENFSKKGPGNFRAPLVPSSVPTYKACLQWSTLNIDKCDAELSACVTRRALTWSLPPDAEGTLVVPYVLTPAQ